MEKAKKVITKSIHNKHIDEELIDYLSGRLEKFYTINKEAIDEYLYVKSKIDELKSRLPSNLHYKLTVLNSKYSGKVINVRLILPFVKNENKKSLYPYFNLHIGKLSNYKLGIDDPQVKIDVEVKIKEFINERYPFRVLLADNQEIELKY
jgi:hypothetical protein